MTGKARYIKNFPRIKLVRRRGKAMWTVVRPNIIERLHFQGQLSRYEEARKFAFDRNWKEGRL